MGLRVYQVFLNLDLCLKRLMTSVAVRDFSMIVASTLTWVRRSKGRPMKENSRPPTNKTFSNRMRSPASAGYLDERRTHTSMKNENRERKKERTNKQTKRREERMIKGKIWRRFEDRKMGRTKMNERKRWEVRKFDVGKINMKLER